jgi:hypothetical protein
VTAIWAAAILLAMADPPAEPGPMTFSVIETEEERAVKAIMQGGQVRIFAQGPIDAAAAERFRAFVREKGIGWARIELDSPGGSLLGGVQLGEAIRELGFDTGVEARGWEYGQPAAAICASACAYAFGGGVSRFVSDQAGRLGIHQFTDGDDNQGDLGEAQLISGALVDYLQEMGVDASAFAIASTAASSDMVWLTAEQAVGLRLANNGTRGTTAEIKLTEGRPYLRLEQVHHDVTSRLILFCESGQVSVGAGIVTSPESSRAHASEAARSYLEFDAQEVLAVAGEAGAEASDSTLWLYRDLSARQLEALRATTILGIWVENGGPMRWGAMMDLKPVQPNLAYFVENCRQAGG